MRPPGHGDTHFIIKHFVILAATDDSALEATVRTLAASEDCEFQCIKTTREAVSMLMDGTLNQNLAIVDLDLREGARSLLSTAGGALPVIAITAKTNPWLSSMQRHHRIEATLTKPVSPENLRDAFERVRSSSFPEGWPAS